MALMLAQFGTPALVIIAFVWLRTDLARLERKVDGLAQGHNGLSRELSELRGEFHGFRGEVRGRVEGRNQRSERNDSPAKAETDRPRAATHLPAE